MAERLNDMGFKPFGNIIILVLGARICLLFEYKPLKKNFSGPFLGPCFGNQRFVSIFLSTVRSALLKVFRYKLRARKRKFWPFFGPHVQVVFNRDLFCFSTRFVLTQGLRALSFILT